MKPSELPEYLLRTARLVHGEHSNKEIAHKLHVSETTAVGYVTRCKDMLGVRTRVGIALMVEREEKQ